MNEMWKPCPYAESSHMVSSNGRVMKKEHLRLFAGVLVKRNALILKTHYNHGGYELVNITNDDIKGKAIAVHRLVALSFCDGYNKDLEVNHIDGNPKNNNFKNLEWVSKGSNILHSYNNLNRKEKLRPTKGETSVKAKITEKQAIEILNSKESVLEIASKFGIHRDTVYNIQKGKRWFHLQPKKNKTIVAGERLRKKPVRKKTAKLTYEQAQEIRKYPVKYSRKELALKFGVSESMIKDIRANKSYHRP